MDSAARWFLAGIIVSLVNTALVIAFIGIPGITDDNDSDEPVIVTETEVVEVEVPITYILVVDEDGNIVREEVRVGRPGDQRAPSTTRPTPVATPDLDELTFEEPRFASVFNPLQVAASNGLSVVATGAFGLTAVDLNGDSLPVPLTGLANTGSSAAIDIDIEFDGTFVVLLRDSDRDWRIVTKEPGAVFRRVVVSSDSLDFPATVNALTVSVTGQLYLSASAPGGLYQIDPELGTITALVSGRVFEGLDAGVIGTRVAYAAPSSLARDADSQVGLVENDVATAFKTSYGRCTGPVALSVPSAPTDVAFAPNDRLLVVDADNHTVWLQQRGGEGVRLFGRSDCAAGSDDSSLRAPSAVAIDSDRNVFITDSGNNRLVILPAASEDTSEAR